MSHQTYIEEIEKNSKKIRIYWLAFIIIVVIAIITLLVIIRKETDFFVSVEEGRLSEEDKTEIEGKLLAGWAKRNLGLEELENIERVLGSETRELSLGEKKEIERKLTQ